MSDHASKLFAELVQASREGDFIRHFQRIPQSLTPVHRHPLGFRVARLIADSGAALRLHIWPKSARSAQPGFEIHDHTFDLTSFILFGDLRQTVYEVSTSAPATHAVYEVGYDATGSVLRKSEIAVAVSPKKTCLLHAGETYALPAAEFHDLDRASAQCAATLVLTTQSGGAPRSLGPLSGAAIIRFERSSYCRSAIDELTAAAVADRAGGLTHTDP